MKSSDVHNVLVAAICIKLVYYVYAMLSSCLLSHGLNRVEGKLFKSGQKCDNWPSQSNGDASCHPVLSCQRSHKKTELLIILQNILSVETVMNGLWPVGFEEVGKHYGTNEAIYEINWNWSKLDISMWGKDVYWQKCKLVGLEHFITFGIGVLSTFFLKHLSSPWPSSSLCGEGWPGRSISTFQFIQVLSNDPTRYHVGVDANYIDIVRLIAVQSKTRKYIQVVVQILIKLQGYCELVDSTALPEPQ